MAEYTKKKRFSGEKLSEEDLVSRIKDELTESLGYGGDELSRQREVAMEYYYGLPFGNEVEGRSQYVDSTVSDTIEWIKPSLMRVFGSGDEMVKFNPQTPDDYEMAEQATDYVNYVFTRLNPGWEILYTWFSDALLQKNGIVKVWWDETEEWNREEYIGLSDVELEALVVKEEVEVLEHTAYDDGPVPYHDVVITRRNKKGQVKIDNVPPDEFLISRESKTIQDARFVCHRVRKTLSELREMGYDVDHEDLTTGDDDYPISQGEMRSRYEFDDSWNFGMDGAIGMGDGTIREYWLHESFLRVDYNGDGIAELRKVCTVGSTVLANDEVDRIPFVSVTPIKIPHKFFGLSVADLVEDLQLMKSTLMRNLMDNMYNQNYGRYAVLEGQANLDDLLTQRPGGVVRVKSPNAVMPLATPALEPYSFQMLEYLDSVRESRAGVTRYSGGLNDNALQSHTTASAVNQVMTAAQSRVELIARNFAETGVKELMRVIYELLQKNHDYETVVLLRDTWIEVRPDAWKDKADCTVSVGLGTGNKDQQMMHLSQMIQFASQSMAGGLKIINERNLYNMGAALVKTMGFMNVSDFLTEPPPEEEGPSAQEQQQQMEMEIKQKELEIKAADVEVKKQKVQLEAQKAAVQAQLDVAELEMEQQQQRAVAIGDT